MYRKLVFFPRIANALYVVSGLKSVSNSVIVCIVLHVDSKLLASTKAVRRPGNEAISFWSP